MSRRGPERGSLEAEVMVMRTSQTFDPEIHEPGSPGAEGRCSHHDPGAEECSGEAVVSFRDAEDQWQSGCRVALEELVRKGEIEPLGQGA
ncbi:hypothetical protein GCM10023339_33060 [Alloalcanivorax gelatiniphagus]